MSTKQDSTLTTFDIKRRSLVILFGMTILLAPGWSFVYWMYDLSTAAIIPLAYAISGSIALLFYWIVGDKGFRLFVGTCSILYFLLPPTLQWTLGGYQNGSGVIIWMFPVVVVAFIYQGAQAAFYWASAFLIGIVFSIFSPAIVGNPSIIRLPDQVIDTLHVLNIACVGGVVSAAVYYLLSTLSNRSGQLSDALGELTHLKESQDGDYFLISYLSNPLSNVTSTSPSVQVTYVIEQKKKFSYKGKLHEIGGDICIADTVVLKGKKYTAFLNGDAMGKSLQGAAGALIMGSVFRACLSRAKNGEDTFPELWMKSCYSDFQQIFEAFDCSMFMSVVFGLVDDQSGLMYYLNAEHPWTVLYRGGEPRFIEEDLEIRKLGTPMIPGVLPTIGLPGNESRFCLKTIPLQTGDMVFIGSDGRDDIAIGVTGQGERIVNSDPELFREAVGQAKGDLAGIKGHLASFGELTDDLSLMRIQYSAPVDVAGERLKARATLREKLFLAMQQRDYRAGAAIAEDGIQRFPERGAFHFAASICNRRIGNLQLAKETGECYRARAGDDVANLVNLAKIYSDIGDSSRARAFLHRAMEIDPANERVRRLLGSKVGMVQNQKTSA